MDEILIAVIQCVLLLKIDILDKFSEVQNGWVLLADWKWKDVQMSNNYYEAIQFSPGEAFYLPWRLIHFKYLPTILLKVNFNAGLVTLK